MNFPTWEMNVAFGEWLFYGGLEASIRSERPQIGDGLERLGQHALQARLPLDRTGHGRNLVMGLVKEGYHYSWLICGLRGDRSEVRMGWPLETHRDVLAQAFVAAYDACCLDTELASPWRWGESQPGLAVGLADGLSQKGLLVKTINTLRRGNGEARKSIAGLDVCSLHIETQWGGLVLSNGERVGWNIDATFNDVVVRLDLASAWPELGLGCFSSFDVNEADLVEGVATIANEDYDASWTRSSVDPEPTTLALLGLEPLAHAVAFLGNGDFGDVCALQDGDPPGIVHTDRGMGVLTDKDIDLGTAQRLYAQVAVDYATTFVILFTSGSSTKDARLWAEKAFMPIFHLGDGSQVDPVTELASERTPKRFQPA